jgi:pyruvate dehydrogenase E2 component (dihydrolipoyllysine-residue acetyltransferase)
MQTVVMPKLGDTMEEGKILNWLKQEGDPVARGDALAEIETEKVNIEVESFFDGVLRKVLAPAGETLAVGAPIALVGAASEPIPAEVAGGPAQTAAAPAPAENTPAAEPHAQGQAEAAPETVRPSEIPQPATASGQKQTAPAGQVSYADREYGEETLPRELANGVAANGRTAQAASRATVAAPQPQAPAVSGGRIFISPIARHIAQEHDLDITRIQGTGPNGRIIRDDVEAALAQPQQPAAQAPAQQIVQPMQPAAPIAPARPGEEVEAVPLNNIRKTIARRLQQSMQTAPHFYVTMAIDATQLVAFNTSVNEYAATLQPAVKVTLNDLIVKGVAATLAKMPQVNVSFDGERLLYKKRINVGVAVALEQGLIVPVIRDADKRGVLELARESRRLIEAARAGKLKPEEFSGGTFSVSNLGMFGVEEFTAIINPPEAAILAIGAAVPAPVVQDGQVVVRDMMRVTLSVDHRALDGATAARFLQELKRVLEHPLGMLL